MSDRFRARGASQLKKATEIAHEDYSAALGRQDWNLAIRRAHEAVELGIKAGILLLGSEPGHKHNAAVVENLVKVAERAVSQFYPVKRNADHIEVTKRVGGTTTVLGSSPVDDTLAGRRMIVERDGSTTAAYVDGHLVLAVTDTTYSIPIGAQAGDWRRLAVAVEWLTDRRESSFYDEKSFGPEDARRAGSMMQSTLGVVEREFNILPSDKPETANPARAVGLVEPRGSAGATLGRAVAPRGAS
jgi:hypothetical protein